jgi:ankyrin repeat protein
MGSLFSFYRNPGYCSVVEPMLRKAKGDASELLRAYPNFDVEAAPEVGTELCYLFLACLHFCVYAVRGLLQCGASLLRKDESGCTALHVACFGDDEEKAAFVEWLLSEHADARATLGWADKWGRTALHLAAGWGTSAVACVLLAHGADLTCENLYGKTPAQIARILAGVSTAKLLEAAERVYTTHLEVGEWRPRLARRYPRKYRAAMRTLVMLAKATQ